MTPSRLVVQTDALAWMDEHPAEPGASVVTSLPDVSELPELGIDAWRAWFVGAARRVVRWVPKGGVAIFYQSDIRHQAIWIDKGHLVMRAADEEQAVVLWHKIVCRRPAGTIAMGRPSYSHMIAIGREPDGRTVGPDVLPDAGVMPWSRAMGAEACRVACRYLKEAGARIVVDPFCGRGTVLAVANEMGLDAIGVDKSAKRCRAARSLSFAEVPGDALERGHALFEAGRFFEAHEAWEDRWRVEKDDAMRRTIQGLIQVAAAFHKLVEMRSPEPAARLFSKGIAKLEGSRLAGIDIDRFVARARERFAAK